MKKKIVVGAVAVVALAALSFGVLYVAGGALFPSWTGLGEGTGKDPAASAPAAPTPLPPLPPEEKAAVQEALDRVAGAEGARAALSGGVDRPWPQEHAMQEFQSCRRRLEGGQGLADAEVPNEIERVCLCVARKMQKTFPGGPPVSKKPRDVKTYSRAELGAIEECTGH